MIPSGLPWLLPGFVLGWVSCWWFMGRGRARDSATHPPHGDMPTPAPVPLPLHPAEDPLPAEPSPARHIDVGAARAAGFNMRHASDLTVIEGIGPKISDLLHANDIETFVQVAGMSVDTMLDLLQRGGPSFRLADPSTWAQQAALAADNRWKDLKLLQAEMIGRETRRDS